MCYGEKVSVKIWVDIVSLFCVVYGYEIYNGDGELCIIVSIMNICVKKEGFCFVLFKKLYFEWYVKYEEIKKK